MRRLLPPTLLLPSLLLAACGPEEDPCGAVAAAGLVGTQVAGARLPEGRPVRVVGPDTMVTMDFLPDRLNVEVDAAGAITGLRCG